MVVGGAAAVTSPVISAAVASTPADGTPSPDAVALAQAADSGNQVEVVADREGDATTFANPDGTLSTAFTQTPTRVATASGWANVDESLSASNGDLAPKVSPVDVSVSGDGDGMLGSLTTSGGGQVGLGWNSDLPDPSVSGAAATYSATSTSAVVVTATPTGFSENVVLASAPSSAPTFTLPLSTNGLTPSLGNGVLSLADASGTVAESAPLTMWDAQTSPNGTPNHSGSVAAALQADASGGYDLLLTPDASFLSDPSTVYPVTVDPTISAIAARRSDVTYTNDGSTSSFGDTRLVVGKINHDGTYSSNSSASRAWISFKMGRFIGRDVTAASLKLYQVGAGSCSAQTMNVFPGTAYPNTPYTWNNNIANENTNSEWRQSSMFNRGGTGSGCTANGFDNVDVTNIVAGHTAGELSRRGLWLQGATDGSTTYGKVFCSDQINSTPSDPCSLPATGPTHQPSLTVTWDTELGSQSSYSMTKHRLNDRSNLMVNNDNGNAVIKADDVQVTGRGMDLDLSRYYNSSSTDDGQFGAGELLSGGPDVRLLPVGGTSPTPRFDYIGPGGTAYGRFVRKTSDDNGGTPGPYYSFQNPVYQGLDADLTDNNDASSTHHRYTLTFHSSQMKYVFDNFGTDSSPAVLIKTIDRDGNEIDYNYNATGIWTSITDTHARTYNVCHNTAGYVTSIREADSCSATNPVGRVWTYGYSSDQLTSYTDPTGAVTSYTWTNGQITTITDPAQTGGSHPTTSLTYSSAQVTGLQYAKNTSGGTYQFTFSYTASGDASVMTASSRCAKDYDSNQNGNDTRASYSTDVTDVSDPQQGTTTYCFTDRNDDTTDESGDRFLRTVDGDGKRRSEQFSADEKPTTSTSSTGDGAAPSSTTATYNSDNMLTDVTDPKDASSDTAGSEHVKYNVTTSVNGNSITGAQYLPSSSTDAQDICTAYAYDDAGNLVDAYAGLDGGSNHNCSAGGAQHVHEDYNADGTLLDSYNNSGAAGSPADETTYTYFNTEPNKGSLRQIVRPGGNSTCTTDRTLCTTYTYDNDSRVLTQTDGNANTTTYSHDADDRVTQVLLAGTTTCNTNAGTCITYSYDNEGNLTKRVDKSGETDFSYDMLNRLTGETQPDGTTLTSAYDGQNNLTSYRQQLPNKSADTVTYGYDAAGNNTQITDSTGNYSISYTDDERQHVLTFPASTGVSVNDDYTMAGRIKAITPSGSSGLNTINYSYQGPDKDGDGNPDETHSLQSMTTNGITTRYSYSGGRLATVTPSSGAASTYSWDSDGNLQAYQVGSGNTVHMGYSKNGDLCYLGTVAGTEKARTCPATPAGDTSRHSDAAGNNVGSTGAPISYNADNQVTSISALGGGATVSQAYTDQGNDLRIQAGGSGGTSFVNGPFGISARTTSAGTTYYTRNANGQIIGQHGADGTAYYYTDKANSTVALFNSTGTVVNSYSYDSLGGTTVGAPGSTTNTPFRWDGGYQDIEGDGYYHFGARYYDGQGHFTQPDPQEASLNDPGSFARYTFAEGDPLNNQDVTGKSIFGDILAGAGLVAGTAALFTLGPEVGIVAGLATVTGFGVGLSGAVYEYGCDAAGGC